MLFIISHETPGCSGLEPHLPAGRDGALRREQNPLRATALAPPESFPILITFRLFLLPARRRKATDDSSCLHPPSAERLRFLAPPACLPVHFISFLIFSLHLTSHVVYSSSLRRAGIEERKRSPKSATISAASGSDVTLRVIRPSYGFDNGTETRQQ